MIKIYLIKIYVDSVILITIFVPLPATPNTQSFWRYTSVHARQHIPQTRNNVLSTLNASASYTLSSYNYIYIIALVTVSRWWWRKLLAALFTPFYCDYNITKGWIIIPFWLYNLWHSVITPVLVSFSSFKLWRFLVSTNALWKKNKNKRT